jgi:hypothetical protein
VERDGFGRIARPAVRWARVQYLRQVEQLIEVQAGPRPRPPLPDRSRTSRFNPRWLIESFTRGLERAVDTGDTFNNVLGVTELGVALRRYRVDRGEYPDQLAALIPAYVARLPIDATTGRPPVYARSGAGFTLKAQPVRMDTTPNAALEWAVAR